jgi:hypothetical protein
MKPKPAGPPMTLGNMRCGRSPHWIKVNLDAPAATRVIE